MYCATTSFDVIKSENSTREKVEPIYPELVCGIALRYLAGGRYQYIRDWSGVSRNSVYRCRDAFFDAVLKSKNSDLAIKFPKTDEERQRAAASWSLKSNPGGEPVFRRCIGAIDGTIIRINQPQCAPNPRRSEASQERQQDD